MEQFIEQFIQYLAQEKGYSNNTVMAYRNDLSQFHQFVLTVRPYLSSWARVDTLLIQAYVLDLKARAYSAASIARKVAALKSFYFYLTEKNVMASNPTLDLEAPRVSKQPPRALSQQQVTVLLSAPAEPTAKGLRDRAMLEVMYATGLRVTELVTLDIRDADLTNGKLKIGSGTRRRSVALTEPAQNALSAYIMRARGNYGAPPENGPLFVNPRGGALTRQGVWLILKQYVAQAGIQTVVTPHSLRHSFAAHRLQEGSSVQEVQRMLGLAHPSATQVYRSQLPALTNGSTGRASEKNEP